MIAGVFRDNKDAESTPPALEYDRTPPVTRRQFRWLLTLTLLNTVMLGGVLLGPQLAPFAKQQYQQWQRKRELAARQEKIAASLKESLAYLDPPDMVVYEESPQRAMAIANSGKLYGIALNGAAPPGYQPPVNANNGNPFKSIFGNPGGATLFLHERFTPSGQRRLVFVSLQTAQEFEQVIAASVEGRPITWSMKKLRDIQISIYDPQSLDDARPRSKSGVRLKLIAGDETIPEFCITWPSKPDQPVAMKPQREFRFFAGQPDPSDRTRFSIRYELDGQEGFIDVWLTDETVLVRPREGSQTFRDGRPAWDFTAVSPPATQPTP